MGFFSQSLLRGRILCRAFEAEFSCMHVHNVQCTGTAVPGQMRALYIGDDPTSPTCAQLTLVHSMEDAQMMIDGGRSGWQCQLGTGKEGVVITASKAQNCVEYVSEFIEQTHVRLGSRRDIGSPRITDGSVGRRSCERTPNDPPSILASHACAHPSTRGSSSHTRYASQMLTTTITVAFQSR